MKRILLIMMLAGVAAIAVSREAIAKDKGQTASPRPTKTFVFE